MPNMKRISKPPVLPARPVDGHKGTFGRVLVIGGSVGMAGAPSLVGRAALRSGAGLVTIAVPEPIQPVVAGLCPCATTIALPANKSGQIKPAATLKLLRAAGWIGADGKGNPPDAVVVGPGLGTGSNDYAEHVWDLIDAFRTESKVPTVVDADGLNLAALLPEGWDLRAHPRTVLTPHPGELARILGETAEQVQANRKATATQTACHLNAGLNANVNVNANVNADTEPDPSAVLVLKGAGTIVTDGASIYTNKTGNPGMATGGSGDVLSGIIAALLAQGMSCLDAAILGVYVHGSAGDRCAERLGQVSMTATDIIESLPEAFIAGQAKRSPRRRTSRGAAPRRAARGRKKQG